MLLSNCINPRIVTAIFAWALTLVATPALARPFDYKGVYRVILLPDPSSIQPSCAASSPLFLAGPSNSSYFEFRVTRKGSPALLMMTVDFRPGPTAKSREIEGPSPSRAVWIIKSAGEPGEGSKKSEVFGAAAP